ncbi:hypothetical protein OS493_038391 [Desmophyllum pertusum]|uniref:Uncharacterized protein n=1 Tax=Desmophyllum pertusum TaxID=174260 RepID=A0A9W9Z6H6_9CNID|nr:hypothetical protein OS493_038391 [Desmophyllum pertusum]
MAFPLGFFGEQGGESIHHEFVQLASTYCKVKPDTTHLKQMLQEHYLIVHPKNRQAIPVKPTRNLKRNQESSETSTNVQIVLLKWRELKNAIADASYIDLLHLSSVHSPFSIKPGTQRVEECLRTVVTKVYGQGKGLRGTSRVIFLNKEKSVQVYHHELEHGNSVIKNRLEKCEEEKKDLKGEIQELEIRCGELLQELESAEYRMQDLENESEKAVQENKQLSEYLDFLEDVMICTNCSEKLKNHGRPIHEVSKRQGNRKIKEVKTNAAKALWFLESFGLTLDSVKVTDKDGKITDLDYGTDDRCSKASFHNLSQEGQDTVSSLLYIMDNFCVGDAAYHEVSMIVDDAPRSYLIKQCRSDLNKIFHISKTQENTQEPK